MNHPAQRELVRRLLAQLDGARAVGVRVGEVPAQDYSSPERFVEEQQQIFARQPQLVALESELGEPGSCLTAEVAGVSLLLVRGPDRAIRAFRNACRHRSTELVSGDAPCQRRAIVCPYHGWTYDLTGQLVHVPHQGSFLGRDRSRASLRAAHAACRHGFVFAGLEPFDLGATLAPIDDELAALGAARQRVFRRSSRVVRANWKLIVDAFLDGYHIRHLHRDTIYRFFLDARAEAEPAGRHIRAAAARRALGELAPQALEAAPLETLVTPSYLVFPSTTLIVHPDYLSVLRAVPQAADRTVFVHRMAIAEAPRTEAEQAHWAKSFDLIDEGVFSREDLAIAEAMQRGIESGANPTLLFGELEHAALWFHESVAESLAER